MSIRYDKKLENELNKVVRNFNQKINRLEKTERDLLLPSRISKKEIKSQIDTRKELKRKIEELKRFSIRGMEDTVTIDGNIQISRYELDNLKRESRRIKSSLTRRINRLSETKPTIFGNTQSATFAQMGSMSLANLKARRQKLNFENVENLSSEGFEDFVKTLNMNIQKENYRSEIFMDNYTNKMIFTLGYYIDYDKEKINYIKERLNTLDEAQFLKLIETEQSLQAIKDYYPTTTDVNPEYIKEEITQLYDALYNNIDSIIKDYA